jgi:predicted adenine nucleotide alpha hydrolase (AANH) superfamily ATPase
MIEGNNERKTEDQVSFAELPEERPRRPALLLHSCCGPCSTAVVERLAQRFWITVYFCNSNIDDEEEYKRRLAAQKQFIDAYNVSESCAEPIAFVCAPYAPEAFLRSVEGLGSSPEGGPRCRICIRDRLEKTAAFAAMNGFEYFTTTLSVSPRKDFEMICGIGREVAVRYGLSFVAEDFKKQNGFKRSIELSAAYCLYRQDYCGCRFSKRGGK